MTQNHSNLRLDEAIALPGCPICRIVIERVARSMDSIDYEFVNDPGWRAEVDAAWGFCNQHAEQWLETAHPLGTAIIYEAVLGRIADRVNKQRAARTRLVDKLRAGLSAVAISDNDWLVEPGNCPFCIVREKEAAMAINQLLSELASPALGERYVASDGLCITHLNAAFRREPDAAVFELLQSKLIATHNRMQDELREVIRKHDYRFQNELPGPERGSVEHAVRHVVGLPGIGDRRYHPPVSD